MPLRIILADDHQIFREALKAVLEGKDLQVTGEASNGQEAVRLARDLRPDVAVLDFTMPLLNGIDAAREIHHVSPQTRTVLLTAHTDDHYVLWSLRAGITGYVVKTKAAEELVRAIQEVSRGQFYSSSGVSRGLIDAYLTGIKPPADP